MTAWVRRSRPRTRYCTIREVLAPVKGRRARITAAKTCVQGRPPLAGPAQAGGGAQDPVASVSVLLAGAAPGASKLLPARKARRAQSARDLGRDAIEALTRQPLTAIAPQQPLDIGLFETPRAGKTPTWCCPMNRDRDPPCNTDRHHYEAIRRPTSTPSPPWPKPVRPPAGRVPPRHRRDRVSACRTSPTTLTLDALGIEDPFLELSGLYHGVDLAHQSVISPSPELSQVFLYRRPILDEWAERGDVSLDELITHVLVHEIGHHFGFSDAAMHAIEDSD